MNESVRELERRGLARSLSVFLTALFFLIVAAGVLRVIGLSISALTDYDDGWEFDVPVAIGEGSFYPRLPVEVAEDTASAFLSKGISRGQGKWILHHYSLPIHVGGEAIHLLLYGALLWGITLLRRVLSTAAGGRPFDRLNPRRLNTLGWIILLSSALASTLQYLVSKWVLSGFEPASVPLSPSIDIHQEWILCGLLVMVLAAIWNEAVPHDLAEGASECRSS